MSELKRGMVGKWNYETREYDLYEPPARAEVNVDDLGKLVACASCSSFVEAGRMFTSREIHVVLFGIGYMVCGDCYQEENARSIEHDGTPRPVKLQRMEKSPEKAEVSFKTLGMVIGTVVMLSIVFAGIALLIVTVALLRWAISLI